MLTYLLAAGAVLALGVRDYRRGLKAEHAALLYKHRRLLARSRTV